MTVKATITSTLNGQSADLILIEEGQSRSYETKSLSGGTETFIFTELDGGRDKEYTAKIVPSTSDVTQTAEVDFGAEVEIDPIPHRDTGVENQVRETAEFNNGVSTNEIGLGNNALVGGLLTTALKDGEVLADDGYVYSSVQAAQDAASSWIFIGPGTFNENVTIDTPGLTVRGSGYDTLLSAGDGEYAVEVQSDNVVIQDMRLTNDYSSTIEYAIRLVGNNPVIRSVWIDDAGRGIEADTENRDPIITSVKVDGLQDWGITTGKIVKNCTITNIAQDRGRGDGIAPDEDGVVANCIVHNFSTSDSGIKLANDSIAIGNRVHNISGGGGVETSGSAADMIIANNRISDCGTSIVLNGSNELQDGNNTGASN